MASEFKKADVKGLLQTAASPQFTLPRTWESWLLGAFTAQAPCHPLAHLCMFLFIINNYIVFKHCNK